MSFIFNSAADAKAVHRAEVPANILSTESLLEALSIALRFPDYFGQNWNALDECICDLSWLPPGDVVIIHKDLPLVDDHGSLSIYLCILRDAVRNWATNGSNLIYASPGRKPAPGELEPLARRKFVVIFPAENESAVRSVLGATGPEGEAPCRH